MTDALVLDWLTVIGATRGIPRGQFLSEMWRCAARRNGVTGSMREVRSGLRKVGSCRCRRDYFRSPACCMDNLEGLAWAVKTRSRTPLLPGHLDAECYHWLHGLSDRRDSLSRLR